jgi:uncharacterized protein (DUF924 family)
MAAAVSHRAEAVLAFWFAPEHVAHWFAADAAFDAAIRAGFAADVEAAAAGRLRDWAVTPPGWLALLILLDQFPRNLHRGDPRAWAQDVGAQQLALSGIAEGFDRRLSARQRVFAYLPLEHAENMALQQRSVALFEALCAEVPAEERPRYAGFLDYARRHAEVIARFGRFPHRNAVLGRASTAEELAYLAQPGAGF